MSFPRAALVLAAAAGAILAQASCARSIVDPDGLDVGRFERDAGVISDGLCISAECPPPWSTCPGNGLCTIDLSKDVHHCGSCDKACPKLNWSEHATALCAGGECVFACDEFFGDCNHVAADGCETELFDDPLNCGACGASCDGGAVCWRGACGCPSGFTQCGNECVQLDSDNLNCGMCGKECKAPADPADPAWICGPSVTPNNTTWMCGAAACTLQCKGGFGDCNHEFCADGCELDLKTDPLNCGACGHACNSGQECVDGACICESGIRCKNGCVDIQNDPLNCGGCGQRCYGPTNAGGGPGCVGGECTYVCNPGWADCDDGIDNGCEANIATNPAHCGSCTTPCKGGKAQACVAGVCQTKECEAGVLQ